MSSDNTNSVGNDVWRTPEQRQRVVNKLMEYLKEHLASAEQEGVEVKETAVRFEESSYTAATSHTDYLSRVSRKMLAVVTESQPPVVYALQLNPGADDQDPDNQDPDNQDPGDQDPDDSGILHMFVVTTDSRFASKPLNPASSETGNWTNQYPIPPGSRERIVNKIMETLMRIVPFTGEEELLNLKKVAVSYEEKIHTAVTSPTDYLKKISLKMLALEDIADPQEENAPLPNLGTSNQDPETILLMISSLLF